MKKAGLLSIALVFAFSLTAFGAVVEIGGPGSVSLSDSPYGEQGLLSEGELATATFGYVVNPDLGGGMTLTLTVTNTSPAVTGTESPVVPDAPVISNLFFSVPSAIVGMNLVSAGGVDASTAGWDFSFDQDGTPSSGFGFLRNEFDAGVEGGPPQGPVIASIYDPNIFDGVGSPVASPLDFVFELQFAGDIIPSGFTADWFADRILLGSPDYIAAADFQSGANAGSGLVTNVVPEPFSVVLLMTSLGALVAGRKRLGANGRNL